MAWKLTPDYASLRQRGGEGPHPVWVEISADLDTPVTAYLKLRQLHASSPAGSLAPSFLLESVQGQELVGRYSYIGCGAKRRIRVATDDNPWPQLADLCRATEPVSPELPPFWGGYVGWIGYDSVRHLEPTVGAPPPDELGMPAADFVEPELIVAFDHVRQRMLLIASVLQGPDLAADYSRAGAILERAVDALLSPFKPSWAAFLPQGLEPSVSPCQSTMTPEAYMAGVLTLKEHIAAGDLFQAVLSQRFSVPAAGDPFTLYRHLRILNPSPYLFFQDWGDYQLVGSSPEVMVRLDGDIATVRPIAGTRRRGAVSDEALCADLLADPKERAEHLMLVDLGRNDLGRVCNIGTVRATELFAIERCSHVLHIVSNLQGQIARGKTGLDLLAACFPAGTLSGAPKIRAMQILNGLEPTRRGPYGGAIGTLAYDGSVNMGITIRTFLVKDHIAHVQAGAGVVAESDPRSEHQECLNKAHALLLASRMAASPTSRG